MTLTDGLPELRDHIRQIPDFPKPGILFYDISTLLAARGSLAQDGRRVGRRRSRATNRTG